MKKTIVMLATASALIAGMASCEKKDKEEMPKEAIKQTVNVNLKNSESYTFVLPKNLRNDPFEISTQAKHYSLSEVGLNSSSERIYQYKPTAGYVGNDVVIVSNDQEREEMEQHEHHERHHPHGPMSGGHKKGHCNKGGEEDHYIITINFNVTDRTNSDLAK